jgi:hypothetical protein
METSFNAAALDSYAVRITNGVAMLGGILMLPALFLYLSGLLVAGVALTGTIITIAIALTLAVWLTLNYAVQPVAYVVTGDTLVVRRRWARALRIPFKQIMGVSFAGALADVPRFGLRWSFNAGVFGYHGPFQLDPYGNVFFAATNRERLVARGTLRCALADHQPRSSTRICRDIPGGIAQKRIDGTERKTCTFAVAITTSFFCILA